jgi:hypothetical protein
MTRNAPTSDPTDAMSRRSTWQSFTQASVRERQRWTGREGVHKSGPPVGLGEIEPRVRQRGVGTAAGDWV